MKVLFLTNLSRIEISCSSILTIVNLRVPSRSTRVCYECNVHRLYKVRCASAINVMCVSASSPIFCRQTLFICKTQLFFLAHPETFGLSCAHGLLFCVIYTVFVPGIAQRYSAGVLAVWSGVRVPAGAGNFSLHHRVQTGSGAHPASYPMATRTLSLGVKWPGREADHAPPSSTEVNNAWSYTSTPPIRLHGGCLVKKSTGTTLHLPFWGHMPFEGLFILLVQ
jgi:hypothetical protein